MKKINILISLIFLLNKKNINIYEDNFVYMKMYKGAIVLKYKANGMQTGWDEVGRGVNEYTYFHLH